MSLLGKIKEILGLDNKKEALQSASKALESDYKALQSDSNRLQSLKSDKLPDSYSLSLSQPQPIEKSESIELQKDSLHLGVAAGYTAHTIKDIEISLDRIESQMLTKEWFISKFDDKITFLLEYFRIHEENERKRFEIIQNFLSSLQKIALRAPEPIKTQIFQQIEAVEEQLPLTFKMKEILNIIKETGEISYDDLSKRLGISVSALRGVLSNMLKRTNEIERFERERKGWVRYIGGSASNRIESLETKLDNTNSHTLV